jgi:transcriptional regulator with XRE-family HTH domain
LAPTRFTFAVGLRHGTPGPRREEVAQLAGIGTTWYSWIEQGREVSVSPSALARLADVVRLSRAERAYLFELSGKRDPEEPAPNAVPDLPEALAPAVAAITAPAHVLDRPATVRPWNQPAANLLAGWLDGDRDRNLLRFLFLDPVAHARIEDWPGRARRVTAEFRADNGRHLDDPSVRVLVEELSRRGSVFAECWREQAVIGREGGERRFNHPKRGRLVYRQIGFAMATQPDLTLVMLVAKTHGRKNASAGR